MRAERPEDRDFPATEDEPRPSRRWGRLLVLFVLAVLLVAGGAWGWLTHGKRVTAMFAPSSSDGVPVVRADSAPFKTRPSDPGGMEVPDRDKLVYQRLQGESGDSRVEHLLPQAEKPVPPPRSASPSAPAPQVREKLPRVPTEAQVRAAMPPPPPSLARAPSSEPEPEDSPPTSEETAPERPSETETAPASVREQTKEPAPKPPVAAPAPVAPPPATPAPAPKETASVREPTKEPAPAPVTAAPASGYLIQIAAVREPERAEAEWARLQRQHADLLRGLRLFVIKADLGEKGVFWRLRAGPFADESQAKSRCADLAKQKVGCLVVKAQG